MRGQKTTPTEEVPDSDRDDSVPEVRSRSAESLEAEALTPEHMFTHRPNNPYCKICQRAKMLAPRARKRSGSSTIQSKAFGVHITIDHVVTRDLRDRGLENEKVTFVVKDVFSKFRYVYPSPTKAPELKDAVKRMKFRHNTSRAYVDENKAVIEREIRTVLEGTRANLTQAGLPDSLWPYTAQHHAMALNTTKRLDVARIPWEDRYGTPFDGLMVPFGAKVLFWNNPKQNITKASKFAPKGEEEIFLGFHIQPGFIWRKECLLAPLKGSRDALANGTLKVVRAKRVEILRGDYTFPSPMKNPAIHQGLTIRTAMQMAQDLTTMTMMMDHQVVMTQAMTTAATQKGISPAHLQARPTRAIKLLTGLSLGKESPWMG